MDTIEKLLDAVRETCSPANDAALAVKLRVVRSAVSNWRSGRAHPDAVVCARIAQVTGTPLARVLGIVGEARAKSKDEKAVWRRLATAAAVVMMLGSGLFAPISVAHQGLSEAGRSIHYAKWLAGLLRRVLLLPARPLPCSPA